MASKKDDSETIHYIITFVVIIVLLGSFATHLFTGNQAIIPLDSFKGSLLLGIVFCIYIGWFAYEDSVKEKINIKQALIANLKTNTTVKFVCIFWIVLIIIPAVCNIFF